MGFWLTIADMQRWFHTLMQHTDYFNDTGLRGAIIDYVHRSRDLFPRDIATRIPDMKTSNARK